MQTHFQFCLLDFIQIQKGFVKGRKSLLRLVSFCERHRWCHQSPMPRAPCFCGLTSRTSNIIARSILELSILELYCPLVNLSLSHLVAKDRVFYTRLSRLCLKYASRPIIVILMNSSGSICQSVYPRQVLLVFAAIILSNFISGVIECNVQLFYAAFSFPCPDGLPKKLMQW